LFLHFLPFSSRDNEEESLLLNENYQRNRRMALPLSFKSKQLPEPRRLETRGSSQSKETHSPVPTEMMGYYSSSKTWTHSRTGSITTKRKQGLAL
jgi:hypothetical protein